MYKFVVVSAALQQIRPSFSRFAGDLSFFRPDGNVFRLRITRFHDYKLTTRGSDEPRAEQES